MHHLFYGCLLLSVSNETEEFGMRRWEGGGRKKIIHYICIPVLNFETKNYSPSSLFRRTKKNQDMGVISHFYRILKTVPDSNKAKANSMCSKFNDKDRIVPTPKIKSEGHFQDILCLLFRYNICMQSNGNELSGLWQLKNFMLMQF